MIDGTCVSSRAVPFEPFHLRPVAALADRVLLPGDPGRALALAQIVLGDDRRMFNHHRGLWGYTGTALDGAALTIQSTGMGGPSAAIVLEELARLGVRRAIRVGTARALSGDLATGDLVAVAGVLAGDGTSRALGAPEHLALDEALTMALAAQLTGTGLIASHDLLYAPEAHALLEVWKAAGAVAADLETGALAAVAHHHGVAFGSVVVIATTADDIRAGDEALATAGEIAGRAAAAALAPA
jgi:uridine phosphorylase